MMEESRNVYRKQFEQHYAPEPRMSFGSMCGIIIKAGLLSIPISIARMSAFGISLLGGN